LNTLVDCSKRFTAGRSVKLSFLEEKAALYHVPEANGFGTTKIVPPPALFLKETVESWNEIAS
jgi:hypothetical protein